jgi:tetratricopeptide (TPR) repeat protein
MARSSLALADFQLGNIDEAEKELIKLIRRYPTFADARAALTALNWSNGEAGKAESNWIAVTELDPRYSDEEWLKKIRRWPPQPIKDLMNFIDLK